MEHFPRLKENVALGHISTDALAAPTTHLYTNTEPHAHARKESRRPVRTSGADYI